MTKVMREKTSQPNGLHPKVVKTCYVFTSSALGEVKKAIRSSKQSFVRKTFAIHLKSLRTLKLVSHVAF